MANWADYFSQAFNQQNELAQKMAFEKWKSEAELGRLAYEMSNRREDVAFKEKQEERRASESDARKQFYQQRNKVFDQFFGGAGGGQPNMGGNFPAGTTVSLGGLTMPVNRKYTEGESKALSGADALMADLNEMKSMYGKKQVGGLGQAISGVAMARTGIPLIDGSIANTAMGVAGMGKGGEQRQNYIDLVRNISNRLLYLKSGAQINEQEYNRFLAQMPSFFRNDKLDVKQIDRFIKEFSGLKSRIESGAKWDDKSKKFVGGEPVGKSSNTINLDELFKDLEQSSEEE